MNDSVFVSGTKVSASPAAFGVTVMNAESNITNDYSIEIVNGQRMLTVPISALGRYTPYGRMLIRMSMSIEAVLGAEAVKCFTEAASELIQQDKDTRYIAKPSLEEQLAKVTRKKKKKPSTLMNGLIKRI